MKYPSQERAYSHGDSWQGYLSLHLHALFPVCVEEIEIPQRKLITIFVGCGKQGLVQNCKCLYQSFLREKQRAVG